MRVARELGGDSLVEGVDRSARESERGERIDGLDERAAIAEETAVSDRHDCSLARRKIRG